MSDITVTVTNTVAAVVVENLTTGAVTTVETPSEPVAVVISQVGVQGPPGATGADGGGTREMTAGASVSGHRVVVELDDGSVIHGDPGNPDHAQRVVGISGNAASSGGSVTVVERGRLSDNSLALTSGQAVFLGADGALIQTPPATGFILQLGAATAADTLQVRVSRPIIRI